MPARPLSKISPEWWDYTTLDREILEDAARLSAEDLLGLARPGFDVRFFDTLEEFYLAEALEYITSWRAATADGPAGICGPIGPTEQLPLVARLVNELEIDLRHAHFWGMDEWVVEGAPRRSIFHCRSPAPTWICALTAFTPGYACRSRIFTSPRTSLPSTSPASTRRAAW